MSDHDLVSVIVPVYGVEAYLSICIDSLLAQTYRNIEIILVDDDSPDQCPQICDDYACRDERVRVLHQKNGGAAHARNVGMNLASGAYIAFVDSDDVPHPDYLEKLLQQMEDNDADISVCAYQKLFVSRREVQKNLRTGVFSAEEYLGDFIRDWNCGLLWNKLFRRDVLRGVRFEEGHVIDDEFFTYKAVMNAKKVVLCDETLYDYRQRNSGVMSQGKRERILMDRMEYYPERFELVTKRYPALYTAYLSNLADALITFARKSQEYPQACGMARQLQRTYCGRVLRGNLSIKEKYAYLRALFETCTPRRADAQEENADFFA